MLTKLIKKSTKIFLLSVMLFNANFLFKAEGSDLIDKIVNLTKTERELDNKIIDLVTFKLAEEQIPIAGDSTRYLFRDEKDNLWLFKKEKEVETQNAEMFSNVAQLIGVDVPVLRGITLPINGKEVRGTIQKIGFDDILRLEKKTIKKLSSSEIYSFQKLQVLDWLLVVREGDKEINTFITSRGSDKILAIDRDDCFKNVEHGRILGLEEPDWDSSFYTELFHCYLSKEIEIDFLEVFQLIDFIQHIEDDEFKEILCFLTAEREIFLKEVLWRKANLKKEFKMFYSNLAQKNKKLLYNPLAHGYKNYAENLLERIKERILTKGLEYQWLKNKNKQENIKIVDNAEVWKLIVYDLWGKKGKINYYQKLMEDLETYKRKESFISNCERLVMELYINQLETKQKLNICRIIQQPKKLNPIQIENNLRVNSYDIFLNNDFNKICMLKEKDNIFAHLRYIDIMKIENKGNGLVSEYMQKFKTNPNKMVYLFLAAISERECWFNSVMGKLSIVNADRLNFSLDKIKNRFAWKYYGYALCDYGEGCIQDGIKNCEKIIDLNNDKESVYAAYMLLGFFYEHNSKNIRFGKGFDIKKAIENYKKALEFNPYSEKACLNLGNLYLIEGLPVESLREFKKVSKLNDQYAKEYFHLKNIRESRNKKKFLAEIKMNTLSGGDHYILGLAYLVKGNKELAGKYLEKAKKFGYKRY